MYAQGRMLSDMQNKADELRAKGDEKGAAALERQRTNLAESFDLANPSIYGQNQESKLWNNKLTRLGADVNSLRTNLTAANEQFQKATFSTPEAKKAAIDSIAKLQKEYEDAYKAYQTHIASAPSGAVSQQPTTQPSTTADATTQAGQRPRTNAKGWNLMYSNGQYAYVNPNNRSEYEVVP